MSISCKVLLQEEDSEGLEKNTDQASFSGNLMLLPKYGHCFFEWKMTLCLWRYKRRGSKEKVVALFSLHVM